MTNHFLDMLWRRKWVLVAVGLPVLIALWWAFRPEKLWVNERVNEPAPFEAAGDPQPILTGRFEDKANNTSGRATIYKKAGGEEYLRLTDLRLNDFKSPDGPDPHVVLERSDDPERLEVAVKGDLDRLDFGPLKSGQGDQSYDVPAGTDVSKYKAVVLYSERPQSVLGWAKLEPF